MKDIETKDELIDYIRQWVAIDEQMKMINQKTKKIRELKTHLTKNICGYVHNKNMQKNKIYISDGTLSFYDKKEYSPLTYGYVENCLGELITDKKQVDFIIQYMKDHRDIQTVSDIRRNIDKKLIKNE
jgi:hypothetical protein